MAAEPFTIYSHKIDPRGVLDVLRKLASALEVEGPDDAWSTITIRGPKRFLRSSWTLSFKHDPGYYAGDDWARQMQGMQGYFARFPQKPNQDRAMRLIQSFRFAISTWPMPEPDLYLDSDDPRLPYVFAVVKHLDGALFTPSALRDAAGRVLYGAEPPHPAAVLPAIYKEVPHAPREGRTRSDHGTIPDADHPPPPTPQRVARRALALVAVTARAMLEREDPNDANAERTRQKLIRWVEAVDVEDELEEDERRILHIQVGDVAHQDTLNATWRLEGLAILAWALGRFELAPHDEPIVPEDLLRAMFYLDVEGGRALLAAPALREPEDIVELQDRLFAIHWRLREWSLNQEPKDFAAVAGEAWFGPLDIAGIRLVDGDIAIGERALADADSDAVDAVTSAALERHLAVSWLCGDSVLYSETDVST
jgi:hypothetical protein